MDGVVYIELETRRSVAERDAALWAGGAGAGGRAARGGRLCEGGGGRRAEFHPPAARAPFPSHSQVPAA